MATLLLQAAGTALGGPIGGAIGAALGYQIDQQLFGPGPRKGPRLDDLAVQSASYGSAFPAIFGTMRVAGTIIWATELEESETVSGAKGQPDVTTYSYAANLAVALSSRRASRIGRIWADGKLLRGAAGDFKTPVTMRVMTGEEDQPVDPLVASAEGIASTPAYRGLVVVVFERLELADFGNRIPLLTFELVADEDPVPLGALIEEASAGDIVSTAAPGVSGYALHGDRLSDALAPLLSIHQRKFASIGTVVDDRTDGGALRLPMIEEMGAGLGDREVAAELQSGAEAEMPASVAIDHYEPARDYQRGRAQAMTPGGRVREQIDAPICLSAGEARTIAEQWLARRWIERDRLRVQLAPTQFDWEIGDWAAIPGITGYWRVEELEREGLRIIAELVRVAAALPALPFDGGRHLPAPDNVGGPTSIALFDPPDLGLGLGDGLLLAAANETPGWRAVPVDVDAALVESRISTSGRESVLGFADTILSDGQSLLIDAESSVEISLVDPALDLLSSDDEGLFGGSNLAMLGDEVIQFGSATAIGPGHYRLGRLLRGRRGTEWAMAHHAVGDAFVLLDPQRLALVPLAMELIGLTLTATPAGLNDGAADPVGKLFAGEAVRPPSPCQLRATWNGADLQVTWVRRSRLGWVWLDGGDVPLGEASIDYSVRLSSATATIELSSGTESLLASAAQLALLGAGPYQVEARMRGDRATSRPISTSIS